MGKPLTSMKKSEYHESWAQLMRNLRLNPRVAVRTLLHRLDAYRPLSPKDEAKVVDAIKSAGIDPDRVIASLSRNTLEEILKSM